MHIWPFDCFHKKIDEVFRNEIKSHLRKLFKKPKGGKTRYVDLADFLVDELETYVTHLKKQGLQQGGGG